jgi:predicted acyl esterase
LAGGRLAFEQSAKSAGENSSSEYDEYVSDPAKPVPYRLRPTLEQYGPDSTWGEWLLDDQRNAACRPDVLVYESEPLKAPLRVAGQPFARLLASTSGSDADWVVKLIDVWPDEVPERAKLGGYQQMFSADILRGRYNRRGSRFMIGTRRLSFPTSCSRSPKTTSKPPTVSGTHVSTTV